VTGDKPDVLVSSWFLNTWIG